MSFGQPNRLGRKKVEMMNVMGKCAKLLIESKLSQSHKTEKMRTLHPHLEKLHKLAKNEEYFIHFL